MAIKKISANLLGNNAVTAASIAGGAISAADIADNSITAAKLSASASPTFGGLTSTGDVGIGTSSINNPFSANTAAQIGDITEGLSLLTLAGTTQGSIYFADSTSGADRYAGYIDYNHSGNYMAFGGKGNGSEMVRIDSSGNVGIGTSSPASGVGSPLTLTSTSTGYVGLRLNGTGSYANDWDLYASGDGAGLDFFGIYDRTNTTYRMVATNTGNVGIGTTTPDQPLTVVGSTVVAAKFLGESGPHGLNIGGNDGGFGYIGHVSSGSYDLTLNSSGNVGIGTTTPAHRLQVFNTTAADDRTVASIAGVGNAGSSSTGGQYLAIYRSGAISGSSNNHAGGILLGISNSLSSANCGIRGTYEYTNGRDLQFFTSSDNTSAPTNKMIIKGDGEVISGVASLADTYSPLVDGFTSDALVVGRHASSGSLGLWRTNTMEFKYYHNGQGYIMTFGSNGVISGDFNDTSDRNLKENITDLNGGLSVVTQLRPRNFDWKKEDKANGVAGFIAQEVEEILPNEVFGNDYVETESDLPEDVPADNGKHLNYNGILAHAVKAIQEQQTIIDALKARLDSAGL